MRCSFTLLILASLALTPAAGQEKENPLEKEVRSNLKDPSKPFAMLVHLKIKKGAGAKFEAAFAKAVAGTRKEKGNRAYDLIRSTKKPTEYVVYESWKDLAALQAHLKTPHIMTLLADVGDLLDGPLKTQIFVPAGE